MNWSLRVEEIIHLLDHPPVEGRHAGEVTGIADLRVAGPDQLSFLGSARYARHLAGSKAGVVIVPADQPGSPPPDQLWIRVANPSMALATLCGHLEARLAPRREPGIHPTAIIDPAAVIGAGAVVGPYCIVGPGAEIGAHAVLESHVRVEHGASVGEGTVLKHGVVIGWGCRIGRQCTLFPGVVVGADGFGFHSDRNGHQRIPQIGVVVVEDNVKIGANCALDRARFAETRVGEGTKLDNLVQVGHNVTIGKHCLLCAQVGIAGSAEFGNFVVLAGQVGVNGHIHIGDGVTATGQTGISKDVPPGTVLSGTPSRPHREEMKRQALLKQLPELAERVRALEQARGAG